MKKATSYNTYILWFETRQGKSFFSPKTDLTGSGAHQASYLMANGFFSVKVITHLHPVSKPRMTGTTILLLLYTENIHMIAILPLYIFQNITIEKVLYF